MSLERSCYVTFDCQNWKRHQLLVKLSKLLKNVYFGLTILSPLSFLTIKKEVAFDRSKVILMTQNNEQMVCASWQFPHTPLGTQWCKLNDIITITTNKSPLESIHGIVSRAAEKWS